MTRKGLEGLMILPFYHGMNVKNELLFEDGLESVYISKIITLSGEMHKHTD